jgi:hypothetical protein
VYAVGLGSDKYHDTHARVHVRPTRTIHSDLNRQTPTRHLQTLAGDICFAGNCSAPSFKLQCNATATWVTILTQHDAVQLPKGSSRRTSCGQSLQASHPQRTAPAVVTHAHQQHTAPAGCLPAFCSIVCSGTTAANCSTTVHRQRTAPAGPLCDSVCPTLQTPLLLRPVDLKQHTHNVLHTCCCLPALSSMVCAGTTFATGMLKTLF